MRMVDDQMSAEAGSSGQDLTSTADSHRPHSRFVLQEHHARTHRFDFRLEKDGVYKSWAIPKCLPEGVNVKRLAVQVEGHELAFEAFEGHIPEADYGAGQLSIWEKGIYGLDEWADQRIVFTLLGQRVSGPFKRIRFSRGRPNEWLIIKRS